MGTNLPGGRHTLDIKFEDVDGNEGEQRHFWFVGKMKVTLASDSFEYIGSLVMYVKACPGRP